MQGKHLAYRPDIDGLRALAVLAVTLFHFNKQWLPGGFVGVDVFFVISGFLITGIIYGKGADFSFGDFYGRRVRRILPAAVFVTLVTLIAGSFLLLPADVKSLSVSAIGATLSAANIYFWLFLDTSYFAASSDTVPLLHMWSLGVEEQFYLIWPALMIVAMKLGGKRLLVATGVILAIGSFAVSEYFLTRDPSFAYYMLPSRAGELLVGALLFLWQDSRRIPASIANFAGILGLALVGGSILFLDERNGFPGIRSILPSLGAALLILTGTHQGNLLSKVLGNPAARYVGLRSFSLYLWHWPVLAFYRYAYGEPTLSGGIACALLMCLLTLVTYHLIETPFRARTPMWLVTKAGPILATSAAVMVVGYVMVENNGYWPTAAGSAYKREFSQHDYNTKSASKFPFNCQMVQYDPKKWTDDKCVNGDKSVPTETLLWGDSHAAHYVGYLKAVGEGIHFATRNISHSSCPPVRDTRGLVPPSIAKSCSDFNEQAFAESKNYRTVIIGASWVDYARIGKKEQFAKTIAELAQNGNQVIIALTVPAFNGMDRMCSAKAIRIPGMDCASNAVTPDNGENEINLYLKALASQYPNVTTFDVRPQICKNGTCSAYEKGTLLYYDRNHMSMIGSESIGRSVVESGEVPQPIAALAQAARSVGQQPAD
ncbi:acyltransferase family protein [Pseudomonas putida]|uniref:acyltransferase family protein n=1 Tax=Pseudomonas putida TaxID=303 RepID=UPI0021F8921E|nr:acyltransferase family protein [Pseudomonas putida]